MAEVQGGKCSHNGVGDEGLVPKKRAGLWIPYRGCCWLTPEAVKSVKLVEEHFRARFDDVLLVTYPKCGTTWLKALAFTVTNRRLHTVAGDDAHRHPLLARHPQDLVPYLEMPYRQQLQHPVSELEEIASPRLLSTHLPVTLLPPSMLDLGCRIVYLCRNPKDVLVSLWHFINKVNQKYTIDKAFELFCKGETVYGPIWEHGLGFWNKAAVSSSESESDSSRTVLFLKYDEMMAQPVEHVKMLAEFLRVPFTDEEVSRGVVEDIVRLCSFDKLKSVPVNSSGVCDRIGGLPMENSSYFRAGKVGDWANHLTQEMANKLDAIVEEKLTGSGLTF